MQKPKLFINTLIILMLVLSTFGNASIVAQADNGHDELKADPRLLQMAEENPDAIFMVIIQKEAKNKDLPDDDPEVAVEKGGGQVKKQLDIIVSFSAEMTGKEIGKLAKNPKVRWISADAPMVSTEVGDQVPFKTVVTYAPLAAVGTVYTVTSTSNSGTGTLRQAITDANNHAGADTISFNISGTGVKTITPTSALPQITGQVILDASTQPGYAGTPLIRITGSSAGSGVNGLYFADGSDGSTVRGLMITKFSRDGIYIASGADGITIAGNWIGTTGTGSTGVGNTNTGIESFAVGTKIGGTGTYDGNVITNSGNDGISLSNNTVTGYVIQGNIIGLDPDGATGGGNVDVGLAILTGTGNTIGGTTAAARNVISKNYEGMEINTASNTIQGNYIGTDITGTLNRGNRIGDGIQIQGTANNAIVGGTVAGAGNLIAYNAGKGVAILAGTGHQVLGNSIYSNTGLGIDLGSSGVTANNGTKSSSLANYGMDYPVITATALGGGILNVTGFVGSAASQSTFANVRLEFFKAAADSTGYGEGQTFVGYLTTDASGNFGGSLSGSGFTAGDKLTATATDSTNNTSEFGPNVSVTGTPFSVFTSAVRADQLPSTLTGQGVTVAVVDSGITTFHPDFTTGGNSRVVASEKFGNNLTTEDMYGHGTHVAGTIGGNGTASGGTYKGMAPGVNLINLKTSDANGMTYESSVVDALQWVYNNKATYNIKVVNLSMNSTVAQSYHTSPLDAAVEILWFNGIIVVVSAGNNGTANGPSTVYPPANDPFVITVGATEDKGTGSLSDDTLAVFSAYGTTEAGFAKPDLVAPGRNIISPLGGLLNLAFQTYPLHRVNDYYFRMSGTSMSAPVVTGAVALLLQDEPNLTPDQVKYRLMNTANKTWSGYDSAKAGAGTLDIYAAVNGTSTQSANTGIVVSQMLSTGSTPITWGSVGWNSVGWNSVGWNSVGWNSVGWNSVGWNSVGWNAAIWDR